MLNIANQIRRKKALDNEWRLYKFIDKNPGLTTYDLSKKMSWSPGKISYYIKRLLKAKMINNSTKIVNGRVNKRYYGKTVKEFLAQEQKK